MKFVTLVFIISSLEALDMNRNLKGTVGTVIGELVVGIVMLFIGLFMIDAVSTATGINASSDFFDVHSGLISTTGTIFSVLGLVIIVVALGTAIRSIQVVA